MTEENLYSPTTRWSEKQRETEGVENAIFFTIQRQPGVTAEQITFSLKNGRHHTLPLGEINETYFEVTIGIILFFRMGMVRIQGRNLEKLHKYLQAKKVSEIREFSENGSMFFDKDTLFISSILYESDNLKDLE